MVLENLGGIAYRQGDYEDCLANLERVRDIRARNMGEDHPTVMRTMLNMATVANGTGRSDDRAIEIYEEVLPRLVEVNGEIHLDTATTLRNMALALRDAGRPAEAEAAIMRARPIFVELGGERYDHVARIDVDLAQLRINEGRWAEAEVLALSSFEFFEEAFGAADVRTTNAAKMLAKIYQERGRPREAARYREYVKEE